MNNLTWIFAALIPFFTIKIFNLSLRNNTQNDRYFIKEERIIRNITLLVLAVTFCPVAQSYRLGQIQTWLTAFFAMALWYWMNQKEKISGILVGLSCLFKPQFVVLLIWGTLRRRWEFVRGAIPILIIFNLISVLLFGLPNQLNYLQTLSFLSRHGESFYPNHSVNGLLNRLFVTGEKFVFPAFNPWVYAGTTINQACLLALGLFGFRKNQPIDALHLSWIALASTMASPIAWEHHYGILLPIYALLLPHLLRYPVFGKMTLPFFCTSYFLSSNYFAITKRLDLTPFSFLQSYLLFGGLMAFICIGAVILHRKKHLKHAEPVDLPKVLIS